MALTNTSQLLHQSMTAILDSWNEGHNGSSDALYWLLRAQEALISGDVVASVVSEIAEDTIRAQVLERLKLCSEYWADVRYSSLEPVTMLWGTVVNAMRVAAKTGRATERQRAIFDFPTSSVLAFFRSAWDKMEVADGLFHVFRAMPAPECQAMAALLNVHVGTAVDEAVMCRLVRLLDSEGPMTAEENRDLDALSNTQLVHATFSGLRGHA